MMKVAFYAPMKAPSDPVPSGDREVARLLIQVLKAAGHEVAVTSRFRSWEGHGDSMRQRRLRAVGKRVAGRLLRCYLSQPVQAWPDLWFTYHLYHKAPDWLGPTVSRGLGIPYVVAEASYSPKQANGPWALGHQAAAAAVGSADAVIALNSNDVPCVRPLLRDRQQLVLLKPFIDTRRYVFNGDRANYRTALGRRFGLDANTPWLLVVAMMRDGDKLESYRVLGDALKRLTDRSWSLLVVGDGEARTEVEATLAPLGRHRVAFAGVQSREAIVPFYRATDLCVWPAVNEAYGMSLLEAQAAGVAVIAGRAGGVADIVRDEVSGLLVPTGDSQAFAKAITSLLDNPERLRVMGLAARELVQREHSITTAVTRVDWVLRQIRPG